MIFHSDYDNVSRDAIEQFINSVPMGRLITIGEDGTPHLGLFNFVYREHYLNHIQAAG